MKFQTLRASADSADPFLFVASTEDKNRKNLILKQEGWSLTGFKRNPIALWNHDQGTPIGVWENLQIVGGQMTARLKLAARGTSEFIDTLWSLIEQKIVRAASVGFMPLDYDIQKDGSILVKKMELREISLVSVPADAGALRVIASASEDVRDRILFGSPRKRPGESADPPKQRNTNMNLAERIRAAEAELTGLRDQITTLSDKDDLTDTEVTEMETLSDKAEELGKRLASMKKAESALALSAKSSKPGAKATVPATARRERDKAELLFRAAYTIAKSHVGNRSLGEIILSDFGGDRELEAVVLAASNPAMTTVQGWAAELIETQVGEFLDLLAPESVWARLSGLRLTFDRAGAFRLPGRTARGLGGNFVGEGAPIPVKQATLGSVLLSPFKMAVITTMTRELAQRSAPAAEPLFRQMMIEDTAIAIDTAFLDATAASAVRPAGLQVLGAGTASAGDTIANIVTDLKGMITAMVTAGAGRRPVWIMNDVQRIGLMTALSSTEDSRPFADEVRGGTLMGYPIIASINVPTGLVALVDQAELAQGYGDSPAIDMSNQATLHMEDTTPLPLVTGAQGSGVAASPMRSLFQTDSLGLRLVWDISWAFRRAGAAQFRTGVAW
jgi:HK97 family phage major capsid protein/HK97 family phage prohead protease